MDRCSVDVPILTRRGGAISPGRSAALIRLARPLRRRVEKHGGENRRHTQAPLSLPPEGGREGEWSGDVGWRV